MVQRSLLLLFICALLSACNEPQIQDKTINSSPLNHTDSGISQKSETDDGKAEILLSPPGCKIGVALGSVHDQYATENFPKAEILRVEAYHGVVTMLKAGQCEYGLFSVVIAKDIILQDNGFKIVATGFKETEVGAGFRKEDPQLADQFNRFISEIRQNGMYDEIYKRWMGDNWAQAIMPDIPVQKGGRPLEVGIDAVIPPMCFVKDEQHMGFDIEIISRFASSIGRTVRFHSMNFGALIPSLKAGKVDAIISNVTITEERAKQILFSKPYFSQSSVLLCHRKSVQSSLFAGAKGLKDKNDSIKRMVEGGAKIATVVGTAHDIYLNKFLPISALKYVNSLPDLSLEVRSGNAKFLMCNNAMGKIFHKVDPRFEEVIADIMPCDMGMGFRLDNKALLETYNVFLKELKASGQFDSIYHKWMTQLDEAELEPVDYSTANGVLRVATTGTNAPYSFFSDEQLKGLDIDIISLFAQSLGRKPAFDLVDFASFIPALRMDKVDVVATGLQATEERMKAIAFSDPHEHMYSCIMAMANDGGGITANGNLFVSMYNSFKQQFYNNLIVENRYKLIIEGLNATVLISLFAVLLGTIIGCLVCWMRMSGRLLLVNIAKGYVDFVRGTPVLVLLMIFFYVVFAKIEMGGITVAVITFGLNFGAYVSEMFRSSIESIDKGQREAGIAMGFTEAQTFFYIVTPQAIQRVLPVYKGEVISLIKMTSIVGYVAVMDLTKASDIIRSRTFDAFFPLILIAVIYFALAWLFGLVLERINRIVSKR